ncbi:hypothetical protein [Mycobacterium stomatepiae]|uniref:hypothetical protein n=1 Tax=Mycobacterium stomatepiae TaxID=470076 RepID=UPI0021F30BA2|nr:hypothetical protein [Mycobacterium stomatepiae]MCV7164569.1 hypothetical protein [Mycobacterium stomatepiae]
MLLEHTEDNPEFAALVADLVIARPPSLKDRVICVPALRNAPEPERRRFLAGNALDWDHEKRMAFLRKVAARGYRTGHIDPGIGFKSTRLSHLSPGECLTEVGARASCVYPIDGRATRPAVGRLRLFLGAAVGTVGCHRRGAGRLPELHGDRRGRGGRADPAEGRLLAAPAPQLHARGVLRAHPHAGESGRA